MLTRLFLIAVFWFAVFRFLGRILRFLSAPATPSGVRRSENPANARPDPPRPDPRRAAGAPEWNPGEVIDVPYEEVKPPGR